MKINVSAIPEEGRSFHFDPSTPWFESLLQSRFAEIHPPGTAASADLHLRKTLQNVAISGRLTMTLSLVCAKCGVDFQTELEVPLVRNLAPSFSGPRAELLSEEEEIELSAEDLEFSFYHGEEINLAEILAEEVYLALPLRFVCQESCRGLCPKCGKNLNQDSCQCTDVADEHPFATLKSLNYKA